MQFKIWLESGTPRIVKAREDIYEVLESNFIHGIIVGKQTVPVNSLRGGIGHDNREKERVQQLAQNISSPRGYFERIIVDEQNDVVEGQHRLEAVRLLQWPTVPILRVADLGRMYNYQAMMQAASRVVKMHPEQVDQIVKHAMDIIWEAGSKEKALSEYEMSPSIQPAFEAAIKAATVRE